MDKLEPGQYYELRKYIPTDSIPAKYIYVESDGSQWLANRVQVQGGFAPGSTKFIITYKYDLVYDKEGNKIPAPENWHGGLPFLKVENRLF